MSAYPESVGAEAGLSFWDDVDRNQKPPLEPPFPLTIPSELELELEHCGEAQL